MRVRLWQKLLVIVLLILIGAIGGLTLFTYQATREAMFEEFHIRGRELAKAIASESMNYYQNQDVEGFTTLLQSLGEAEGVLAILAYTGKTNLWMESSIIELAPSELVLVTTPVQLHWESVLLNGMRITEFVRPVPFPFLPQQVGPPETQGWIRVILDRQSLEARLTLVLWRTLGISALTMLVGGVLVFVLLRQSLKVVTPLTKATQQVASGRLDISVPVRSNDELGQLATGFNQMTERLYQTTVSKEYLDSILKSMIDSLIVIGPAENIHSTNQATLTLLGYQESEIIGQGVDRLFPQNANPFQDKEFYELLLKGTLGHIETRYLTKDGLSVPVLFSAAIMKEHDGNIQGIACVAQDITNRKLAEKALRDSVERFDMAVRGSQDGIWDAWAVSDDWFDPHNPVYYSPRFKELLGYKDNEFEDTLGTWASRLHPEDRAQAFDDLKIHLEQRIPYDSKYRMFTKSGECRWFAGRGQAIWDENGKPIRMSGSFGDITEQKIAEEELQKANAQLQELDLLRTQFFADISHELRTPLTVIRGEAEVTLRGKDKPIPDYKTTLERIVQLTDEVNKLVSDLLFLARSETGTIQITKTELALENILQDVLQEAAILAQKKHIMITFIDPTASGRIYGDPQRLKQLLLILLDNAIKYSGPNSHIQMRLNVDSQNTTIEIMDQGQGIAEQDLPHIFDRFYRGHSINGHTQPGAGLGLAIAKWITEAHGGQISFSSRPGEGSTATIRFPQQSLASEIQYETTPHRG